MRGAQAEPVAPAASPACFPRGRLRPSWSGDARPSCRSAPTDCNTKQSSGHPPRCSGGRTANVVSSQVGHVNSAGSGGSVPGVKWLTRRGQRVEVFIRGSVTRSGPRVGSFAPRSGRSRQQLLYARCTDAGPSCGRQKAKSSLFLSAEGPAPSPRQDSNCVLL